MGRATNVNRKMRKIANLMRKASNLIRELAGNNAQGPHITFQQNGDQPPAGAPAASREDRFGPRGAIHPTYPTMAMIRNSDNLNLLADPFLRVTYEPRLTQRLRHNAPLDQIIQMDPLIRGQVHEIEVIKAVAVRNRRGHENYIVVNYPNGLTIRIHFETPFNTYNFIKFQKRCRRNQAFNQHNIIPLDDDSD